MLYLLLAAAALAAVAFWLLNARLGQEPLQHFRCASCRQKLRYRSGRAGRKVVCPQCLKPCILPREPEDAPAPRDAYRLQRNRQVSS